MVSLTTAEAEPHNSIKLPAGGAWTGRLWAGWRPRETSAPLQAGHLQVPAAERTSVSKGGKNRCSRLGG